MRGFQLFLSSMVAIAMGIGLAQPSGAQAGLDIGVDYAAFAYSPSESLVEIYLGIGAASLDYAAADSGYQATVPMEFGLWHASDATLESTPEAAVWTQSYAMDFDVPDTSALAAGQVFVRQVRVAVPPGEYELRVAVAAGGDAPLSAARDLIVPDFAVPDACAFSDVTLASQIRQSDDREDAFYKNGLFILPNARELYGEGASMLFYYAEAYNTDCAATAADEYTLLTYVAEANRPAPIAGMQKRTVRKVKSTDVLIGTFQLNELVSGTYFLRFAILNAENESVVEQSRKFFVYNPSISGIAAEDEATVSFESSGYATMPEEEVETALGHVRTIATEQEDRRIRRSTDLDEKRRFLMEFWQVRDPSPGTAVNEFRDGFYSRLMYANERYSIRSREGWDTDRGQVLIKYGVPSSIEPHLYERGLKPYEIWQYNSIPGEGQAQFVFADLDGFGDFELIHSTVAGERKMANWLSELGSIY